MASPPSTEAANRSSRTGLPTKIVHAILALAFVWISALIQSGLLLGWDEIEYFRATRWVAQGRLPFRDFWEHHTPLQWFLFAPVARFADWPGVASIVLMRWIQVVLWLAIFALIMLFAWRSGANRWGRTSAFALLVVSTSFVTKAIEYRVDVPGNLAYLAAIALILAVQTPRRWILFGFFMSAAALANMRLAPLIVVTSAISFAWRSDERRWRFNPQALWMAGGVAGAIVLFLGLYAASGATSDLMRDLVQLNLTTNKYRFGTFGVMLLAPLWRVDFAAIVFWLAAIFSIAVALSRLKIAGPPQILAVLAIVSLGTIWTQGVHYEYHFQITYLLLFPLAAVSLSRLPIHWRWVLVTVIAFSLSFNAWRTTVPSFGGAMRYQDEVMRAAEAHSSPAEAVWDGVGYALTRKPAYHYWFLPTGIRFLAAEGKLPPFGAPQMLTNPPAVVIADKRVLLWFDVFPQLRVFVTRHYLPLYRNLWLPGMTAQIEARPKRFVWRVVKSGRYQIYTSDLLMRHPWFQDPIGYTETTGLRATKLAIPLRRLPPVANASLHWRIDGQDVGENVPSLDLRRGSDLELVASAPVAAGVLVVSEGLDTLCIGPEEDFVF